VSLIIKYLVSGVMENGIVNPTKVRTPQGGKLATTHLEDDVEIKNSKNF
jgi:hypothetical protein